MLKHDTWYASEVTVLLCESNRCCVLRMVGKYTFTDMALCIHYVWPCIRRWSCGKSFLPGRISSRRIPGKKTVLALICVIGKDGYNEKDKEKSSICFWKVESRVTLLNVLRRIYVFIMINLCWLWWEGSCRTQCSTDWLVLLEHILYTNHLWRVCVRSPQDYPGRAKFFFQWILDTLYQ